MKSLPRVLLRCLLGLLALAAVWLLVIASGWLPRPSAAEIEALAAVRSDAAQVSGSRNAFAALYLFDRDVPEAEWETVAAADVARLHEYRETKGSYTGFEVLSAIDYPPLPVVPRTHNAMCEAWKPDCLLRVRSDLSAARDIVMQGRAQLARGEQLANYDYYASPIRHTIDSPIGVTLGNHIGLLLTAAAVDHIDGNSEGALGRLCSSSATWRRLRANTDMLIVDMLGIALIGSASSLYSEIIAELPPGSSPACDDGLGPLADAEFDQCPVFASEFRMWENTVADMTMGQINAALGESTLLPFTSLFNLVNKDHSVRKSALVVGQMCLPVHRERIQQRSGKPLALPETCRRSDWLFDPVGCRLFALGAPGYNDYYVRVLDLDARLRLLANVIWLRQRLAYALPTVDAAMLFAERPPELDSPAHAFSIDATAGMLRMRPMHTGRGAVWEFPFAAKMTTRESTTTSTSD